jgi:hypothetical protein
MRISVCLAMVASALSTPVIPLNEDYAVTGNTKSNVEVVGEWAIEGSRV